MNEEQWQESTSLIEHHGGGCLHLSVDRFGCSASG